MGSPNEQPFLAAYKLRLASANSRTTPLRIRTLNLISEEGPAQHEGVYHKVGQWGGDTSIVGMECVSLSNET